VTFCRIRANINNYDNNLRRLTKSALNSIEIRDRNMWFRIGSGEPSADVTNTIVTQLVDRPFSRSAISTTIDRSGVDTLPLSADIRCGADRLVLMSDS
jgi:hypothetical protein